MYTERLKSCISESGLGQDHWRNDLWKTTAETVTEEVLENAQDYTEKIRKICSSLPITSERTRKEFSRFQEKLSFCKEYFKVVCDFIAFRVESPVEEIENNIIHLKEITIQQGGIFYVREPYFKKQNYEDIVQYVYVYFPEIPYVMEFQFGHPFALYVFSCSSKERYSKEKPITEMWDTGLYERIKGFILDKANGASCTIELEDYHHLPKELFLLLSNL